MKKTVINKKLLVADIETMLVANTQKPIAISDYDGINLNTIIINFNKDIKTENIIKKWINNLIIYTEKDAVIYFHNLGRFDGFLLMQELKKVDEYKTKILMRENIIYEIKIEAYKKKITFKDSYLMLNSSLENAALAWKSTYLKETYNFENNTMEHYKNSKGAVEQLKLYIENDVKTLWEVLKKFSNSMKNDFHVEITKMMTLYSMAQNIFLNQYYEHTFKSLNKRLDEELRPSYLGGIVDIFKPYGTELVMLDFNSMYPSIMAEAKFGIDKPKKVLNTENLSEFCKKLGFVKVKVKCNTDFEQPLLAFKVHEKIIQPQGSFEIVATTLEISYCLEKYKQYYSFEFITGWYFEETAIIFKEFINVLYQKKIETNNPIYKVMMNSLYGRFGMKLEGKVHTAIIRTNDETEFQSKPDIEPYNIKQLDENYMIYNYRNTYADIDGENDRDLWIFKLRVDWAAQITAHGRLKIQELKDKLKIYYVDTDAIVIKKDELWKIKGELDEKALGKLKIVTYMEEAIFLAPKCYAYRNKGEYHFVIKGVKREDIKLGDKELFEIFKQKLQKNSLTVLEVARTNSFKINHKSFNIHEESNKLILSLEYDKREKVYNEEGIWVDTKPLKVNMKEEDKKT